MIRRLLLAWVALLAAIVVTRTAAADVFRPAYLELKQRDTDTLDVFWKVPALGDSARLAIRVEFPPGTKTTVPPRGGFVPGSYSERFSVQRAGGFEGRVISVAGLPGSVSEVLVRVERRDGTTQLAHLLPGRPRFVVAATADRTSVARTYLKLGVEHILTGADHLLYILAMLLLVKSVRRMVATMTAFTATHSLTLTAASLGWVHVPQPPVEACIAISILFVAREAIEAERGQAGLSARFPWLVSFTFGLLHGFGFAGALAEVGLPERAIPTALLFFNVGVELGQLAFVLVAWKLLELGARVRTGRGRWVPLALPYAIGATATFWTIERVTAFGSS